MYDRELSSCGVGFVASLKSEATYENLALGLKALVNLEHRGGSSPDGSYGDGAGVMTDIPYDLLGVAKGDAVANLFLPTDATSRIRSLQIFEETFRSQGLEVYQYREVPFVESVLPPILQANRPGFLMAYIRRPSQCSSRHAFERMLYSAKQLTRSRLRQAGILKQFFFTSLSAATVVYKALVPSKKLAEFYPDLVDQKFKTRFVVFHRRFSTNTATAWDTAQPFRIVGHNGEINTISGNRNWAYARERALGLNQDELLTHIGISDSGSVNEMIEALMFRSSIPHPEDILAILMPPAGNNDPFYRFWGRGMEAWDGPALFTFSDGRAVGARLDRSGFRPCRWATTATHFFLSSEAGSFEIPESEIQGKGSLLGGASVRVDLKTGDFHFRDASQSRENRDATFDPRLKKLEYLEPPETYLPKPDRLGVFSYSEEDLKKTLQPMIAEGKEGMGSMGDTARLAVFSSETRSLFDYFFQHFAQVTNPPLDYVREALVTDLTVFLGRRPNIFEPKELIPQKIGIELPGPVLSLGQMEFLKSLSTQSGFEGPWPGSVVFDITFSRSEGIDGLRRRIEEMKQEAALAIKKRVSLFILSDRRADFDRPPIPSVLALSAMVQGLNQGGMRLRTALVVDSGEVRSSHDVAVLVGFGAAAVCPYVPLELARFGHSALTFADTDCATVREQRCIRALETGLLRIMAKMGISAVRSYQSAELFTLLGLGQDIHREFFSKHRSLIGGLTLEEIVHNVLRNCSASPLSTLKGPSQLLHNYLYKEHPKQGGGEAHSMTLARSKLVHRAVRAEGDEAKTHYRAYRESGDKASPITLRHLLRPKIGGQLPLDEVEPAEDILKTFGAGAMSFGAISAESQRDLILAMRQIGGRSNSGEGGENPYYYTDGITATTKQIASGRFGVTAEYLVSGQELQIKICQGAKPGEGGQLMAAKVSAEIARARHSDQNVDLISPPPMHDIYSIEDLKQLIYELRQLKSDCQVSVKLVSGENIGTIAVGVAKAGADIIHISGHDGGTGAASLGSMKHAGLPWELGLIEVHRALVSQGLRKNLILRVDGGLATGKDVVLAGIMGADQFDFGKLLLVAEGCIMARVCEKNTCPTGIATHDPNFKRLYRGTPEQVASLLRHIADDIREHLASIGIGALSELPGRSDLLEADPNFAELIRDRGLNLDLFLAPPAPQSASLANPYVEPVSDLNARVLNDVVTAPKDRQVALNYYIQPSDRAVPATLQGRLAEAACSRVASDLPDINQIRFFFRGSAGQGFGVFLTPGMRVRLTGEANDSVGKSMSGGRLVLVPSPDSRYQPECNTILGNCALYGATGGVLYARGLAGNRFAVRNSGATAVVEGVGMHGCEYMTRGTVLILGAAGMNLGAGMTGGTLYIRREQAASLHRDYVSIVDWTPQEEHAVRALLMDYAAETSSVTAQWLLDAGRITTELVRVVPLNVARTAETRTVTPRPTIGQANAGAFWIPDEEGGIPSPERASSGATPAIQLSSKDSPC